MEIEAGIEVDSSLSWLEMWDVKDRSKFGGIGTDIELNVSQVSEGRAEL